MTDHVIHDLNNYENQNAKEEQLQQIANDYAFDNILEFLKFTVGDLEDYLENSFDEEDKLKFYLKENYGIYED